VDLTTPRRQPPRIRGPIISIRIGVATPLTTLQPPPRQFVAAVLVELLDLAQLGEIPVALLAQETVEVPAVQAQVLLVQGHRAATPLAAPEVREQLVVTAVRSIVGARRAPPSPLGIVAAEGSPPASSLVVEVVSALGKTEAVKKEETKISD
jgi:hypothetical protein